MVERLQTLRKMLGPRKMEKKGEEKERKRKAKKERLKRVQEREERERKVLERGKEAERADRKWRDREKRVARETVSPNTTFSRPRSRLARTPAYNPAQTPGTPVKNVGF
jgi:hypothetical protein